MSSRLASQIGWSFSQLNKLLRALLLISSSEASKRTSHNKLVGESCPSEKFEDGESSKEDAILGFL
jgi:glucose uptake protein GlcU